MNLHGARAAGAARRGIPSSAPVVVKRVVVDRPVRSVEQAAEVEALMDTIARLIRERDEWRAECARLEAHLELRSAA